MYKLYYMPAACSLAIHTLLKELGQKFEMENVRVKPGEAKSAEFLKANPRGQVPVLVDDGFVLREGMAIFCYLIEKHNSDLLPKSGQERSHDLEWLAFANATLHPLYGRVFHSLGSKVPEYKQEVMNLANVQINKLWAEVDAQLAKTKFIAGDKISAADILLTVIANWGVSNFPFEIKHGDNVKRMLKAVVARPAFQKALQEEGVEYKAV